MSAQSVKDVKKEIYLMLHKAEEMLQFTEEAFSKNKTPSLDQALELANEIHQKEDALTESLAKNASSDNEARSIIGVPSQIEKAVTSIERIVENTRIKIKDGLLFSDKAIDETNKMLSSAKDLLKKAGEAVVSGKKESTDTIVAGSDTLIRMADSFATAHEERLVTGECAPKASSIYLCILYAFGEMASYTKNAVRKLTVQ